MKIKSVLIAMLTIHASVSALADNATISGVNVQQRWPWSRLVDIDYVLECDPGESMDISVEAYNDTSRLTLPLRSFSGDLFAVQRGARRIVWDPTQTAYVENGVLPDFRLTLIPHPVPLYMVVDLTQSAGEAGQTEYVYESDLTNGFWGAWVRNPVTNRGVAVESVVWTDVTNLVYKTDKLVLRRIPKGTFERGTRNPPTLSTTLTKDFYAGVFQVTQRQWELIMGDRPSSFSNPEYYKTRPVERTSYNSIRGATNSVPAINWPGTGSLVLSTSFMGILRAKTGFLDFDLPTDAQWEYACRAGTATVFNDGDASANTSGANATTNTWLNALGRYKFNGGYTDDGIRPDTDSGPENGTAIVGSYLPNAWGLYDMHGNVMELCLDWHERSFEGGVDPIGLESGSHRVRRGGSWNYDAAASIAGSRHAEPPHVGYNYFGFRIVRTLP